MNRSTFFDRSDPVPVPISNSVPFLVPFHQSPFQFQFQFQFRTSHNFETFLSNCFLFRQDMPKFCYRYALSVQIMVYRLFFGGGKWDLPCNYLLLSFPQLERIDRSGWRFVKFSFHNLERRSDKVPKFGTSIRNGVKITTFRHALILLCFCFCCCCCCYCCCCYCCCCCCCYCYFCCFYCCSCYYYCL